MKDARLVFADERVEIAYNKLSEKPEFFKLKKFLDRAIEDIRNNSSCGIGIKKKLIPREYMEKYDITSLFKYDLPDGWRLFYSLETREIFVLAIILEWMSHKDYEKKFKYAVR